MLRNFVRDAWRCVAACCLTMLYPATAWADSTNGLCVVDINLHLNPKPNTYKYDSAASGAASFGVKTEITGAAWDVPLGMESGGAIARTIMNLSYKLGRFDEGNCLDGVTLVAGRPGQAITPITSTDQIWGSPGHWYSNQVSGLTSTASNLVPSGKPLAYDGPITNNVLLALFTRRMSQAKAAAASQWIITGIQVRQGMNCQPYTSAICAGTWVDEQGTGWRMIVSMEPVANFVGNGITALTGQWKRLFSCVNCSTTVRYSVGIINGSTLTTSSERYRSLSTSLQLENEASVPLVGKSKVTVGITGTLAWTDRKEIANSFTTEKTTENSETCDLGAFYQWQTTATWADDTSTATGSNRYVCTKPTTPVDTNNINWMPSDAKKKTPIPTRKL